MSATFRRFDNDRDPMRYQGSLPRLRDVLGDMLEPEFDSHCNNRQPFTPPSPASASRAHTTVKSQLPPTRPETTHNTEKNGPRILSPLCTPGIDSRNSTLSRRKSLSETPSLGEGSSRTESPPSHSYDVFVLKSGRELDHKRSSPRDDHHDVARELAISSSSGKYSCTECGRRFQKNSTLKNHMTTHSGERPHECPYCHKNFSISSNMRRHLERVHRTDRTLGG